MSSGRGTGTRRRRVQLLMPRTKVVPARLKPKQGPSKIQPVDIGFCLTCPPGENRFRGPRAVRLTHGIVERPPSKRIGKVEIENFDAQFKEKKFPDGERYKYLCPMCTYEHDIIEEDTTDFTDTLQRLDIGWCCLCGQPIEAWPDPRYASAVLIERGTVKRNENYDPQADDEIYVGRSNIVVPNPNASPIKFNSLGGGTVHYLCMDDLGVELWSIIEPSDEPDYSWPE